MHIFLVSMVVGWMFLKHDNSCHAMDARSASGLSPDIQEVVTLSREGMSDDVITNYIVSSGKTYILSTNDIIYLAN